MISQNLTYTIPSTPTRGTGTDSTQGGLVSIGITLNGLAIFNNAAAPPDVLASEATTISKDIHKIQVFIIITQPSQKFVNLRLIRVIRELAPMQR